MFAITFCRFSQKSNIPFCQIALLVGQFWNKYPSFNYCIITVLLIRPLLDILFFWSCFMLSGQTTFSNSYRCVLCCEITEISLPSVRWEKTPSCADWKHLSSILLLSIYPDILTVRLSEEGPACDAFESPQLAAHRTAWGISGFLQQK